MFERELRDIEKRGLLRRLISRSSPQRTVITITGRRYLNFSSNDYLGLSFHPEVINAAIKAARRYGSGAGASRLLAGGCALHERLERLTAKLKSAEAALLFNSGYAANTGVIPAISCEGDALFSDELNHASIIDGCRLSRARTVVFRHRDVSHLERLLGKEKARSKIVITDSVFSMDGDIAPLGDIAEACRRNGALLYIDDAHGTGVLGRGKGCLSHFGLKAEPWIIQMGTYSKALGSFGAFAAGEYGAVRWITNSARSFIFSTALPPAVIAASIAAIEVLDKSPGLVERLWTNRELLVRGLRTLGYDVGESQTPILPLMTGSLEEAADLSAFLFERGIYAPAIRPPAVKEPRVRVTVSAAHTEQQLGRLLIALKEFSLRRYEKVLCRRRPGRLPQSTAHG